MPLGGAGAGIYLFVNLFRDLCGKFSNIFLPPCEDKDVAAPSFLFLIIVFLFKSPLGQPNVVTGKWLVEDYAKVTGPVRLPSFGTALCMVWETHLEFRQLEVCPPFHFLLLQSFRFIHSFTGSWRPFQSLLSRRGMCTSEAASQGTRDVVKLIKSTASVW